tara:strand:- start:29 stop:799 length:771 start_codon:yes stop_codon:yes gene_type:complete
MGADTSSMVNYSTSTYVGWAWKAGGTAVSNTDGTITSSVSANPTVGFSIVSYTGTGTAATIGHGLSQAPDMIILKKRSGIAQWPVGVIQDPMNFTDYMALDKSNNYADYDYWNDTAPTSSVFSLSSNADVNESTGTFISYCFHSVDGYSKVGSYVGNGNADGPFIYTGFKPAFLIYKNMDSAGTDWGMVDNKRSPSNVLTKYLAANEPAAEITNSFGDLVSNGIKIRNIYGGANTSTNRYLFIAFAETPFKTSNAR